MHGHPQHGDCSLYKTKEIKKINLHSGFLNLGVVVWRLHGGDSLLARGSLRPTPPAISLLRPGAASEGQDSNCRHLDGHVQEDLLPERHTGSFHQAGV